MVNNHPRFPGIEIHRPRKTMDPITLSRNSIKISRIRATIFHQLNSVNGKEQNTRQSIRKAMTEVFPRMKGYEPLNNGIHASG